MTRLPFAVALLAFVPNLALAQTPESGGARFEIIGEAPSACVVRPPSAASGVNATVQSAGSARSEIRIVQMVDSSTGQARATSAELALPIICNAPHRVTLRSRNGGLLREGRTGRSMGGFAEFLPYRLSALWLGRSAEGASDMADGFVIDSFGGGAGQMSLSIDVPAGGRPLVAGRYADELVIEFQVAN